MAAPVSHQTLGQAVEQRTELIDRIREEGEKLNEIFNKSPGLTDTKIIQTMRDNLVKLTNINKDLEERKEQLSERKCCNCLTRRGVKVVSLVAVLITFVALVGTCIALGIDYGNNGGTSGANLAVLIVLVFAAVLEFTGGAIKVFDDDRDKMELMLAVSRVETRGEEHFQRFLEALEKLNESKGDGHSLPHCIHELDRMPDSGYRETLPGRARIIAKLLEGLPEEHPTKMRWAALKREAELMFGTTSENTSSSDMDETRKKSFSGEKANMETVIALKGKEDDENNVLLSAKDSWAQSWRELEDTLGARIDCIPLTNGKWVDSKRTAADNPEWLLAQRLPRVEIIEEL